MKKDNPVKTAIDESLHDVRFSAQDMRSVLRSARVQAADIRPRRASGSGRAPHLGYALAAAMLVMVIAPLSLIALQHGGHSIKTISAAPGEPTGISFQAADGDPLAAATPSITDVPADDGVFDEQDAIAAARTCFESLCDTSIFTFEEYTVSTAFSEATGGAESVPASFTVLLSSIYDNGCTFRVVVSAADGEILSHSTPKLATIPAYLNMDSAEIRSWYDKYGPYTFAWPLDVQAEFSRRYEGASIRMPHEGEAGKEDIAASVGSYIQASELTDDPSQTRISAYITLYSERSSADGAARYQVYCFAGDGVEDTLPPVCGLLTFRAADGAFESKQILTTNGMIL